MHGTRVVAFAALALVACGEHEGNPNLETSDADGNPASMIELPGTQVYETRTTTLRVANTGEARTGALGVSITGPAAGDFAFDDQLTTCAGARLAAGDECTIGVRFRPTAVGDRSATLEIASAPGVVASVALTGRARAPMLHFLPEAIDFGQIETGHVQQRTIELRNDGKVAAALEEIAVAGDGFARGISTCGAELLPGASCDLAVSAAPTTLGALSGTLSVRSGGERFTAGLAASGARRVTVVRQGNGGGTVTSTPAGIDCGATCTGLFATEVVLTAAPGTDSVLVGWSIAACGNSVTCPVPAGVVPAAVTASFAKVGNTELEIVFAGDASGEVQVTSDLGETLATCFASCTVPTMAGTRLTIAASTPSTFGGLSGPGCSTIGSSCSLDAPAGKLTIMASFQKDAREQWTRLVGATVHTAAYDSAGNLIAGSSGTGGQLFKLSSTGATLWTKPLDTLAVATGPSETIYVIAGGKLQKLDPAGNALWSTPVGTLAGCNHCLAVGADGAVVVVAASVSRWAADGTPSWSKPLVGSGDLGVAIDATGNVSVGRLSPLNGEAIDAVQLAADGTPLPDRENVCSQYFGAISSTPSGTLLASCSGHGDVYYRQGAATGSVDLGVPAYVPNRIAGNDAGVLGWVYELDGDDLPAASWRLTRPGAWSLTRPKLGGDALAVPLGTKPLEVAVSPAGQIALVGTYTGFTFSGGWIQTYDP